jgi:hypothetical protein
MAKLNREAAVRDRRLQKQAKKNARKAAAAAAPQSAPNDDAPAGDVERAPLDA